MPIYAKHNFMPVGQGLFGTGSVGLNENYPDFRWVYDCGSLSRREYLKRSIDALEAEVLMYVPYQPKPRLDLVVISHFDGDHLNGLAELLTRFRVRTLMLPFTHLEQRVRSMLESRKYTAIAKQRFALDPVGTIATIEGAEIERIVMVPPSGAEPAPGPNQGDGPLPIQPGTEGEPRGDVPHLHIPEGRPESQAAQEEFDASRELLAQATNRRTELVYMRRDSVAQYLNIWEFIPYNDPEALRNIDANFVNAVRARRSQLLALSSEAARKNAVAGLKRLFDARMGKSGKRRNIISLFMYSGPIAERVFDGNHANSAVGKEAPGCGSPHCFVCWQANYSGQPFDQVFGRTGFLYTGDGFVEKLTRWEALFNFYGPERVGELLGLQVMHHGSSYNWYKGLAREIQPAMSVFSSDPDRGGKKHRSHPHSDVWNDFIPYRPRQADKERGVQVMVRYGR